MRAICARAARRRECRRAAVTAAFTYSDANGVAVRFECSENGGTTWVACDQATSTSGVFAYTWTGTLASGSHNTFLVRGLTLDGTADEAPARWEWSIEVDPDDDGLDVGADNCPDAANADQADADQDGEGDVCDADWQENDFSVTNGFRILSSYRTKAGIKFWIITEADRSATTILLPEEY